MPSGYRRRAEQRRRSAAFSYTVGDKMNLNLLSSNRVKLCCVAFGLAFVQHNYPHVMPSIEEMKSLYLVLAAMIAGDTVRPIDPAKPKAFG